MSDQPSTEQTLQKTLAILVHKAGLTPEELAILRLGDLQLAGKTPNITFTPSGEDSRSKKIDLDLDSHRALVGWLVVRPDSVNDYLFINDDLEGMSPEGIRTAVANEASIEQASVDETDQAGDVDEATDADATLHSMPPTTPVPPVRPVGAPPPPPRSGPEMGGPPPGFAGRAPFAPPPPSAPESGPPAGRTVPVPPPFAPEADDETPPAPVEETLPGTEEKVADSKESKPIPPPPEGMRGPRVPPKPIRKSGEEPSPVMVKQDPEKPVSPTEADEAEAAKIPMPVVPPPVPLKPEAVEEVQATTSKESVAKAAVAGAVVAEKSKLDAALDSAKETPQPEGVEKEETEAAVAAPVAQEPGEKSTEPAETEKREAQAAVAVATAKKPDEKPAQPVAEKSGRPILPLALGGFVVLLMLMCIGCLGSAGWLAMEEKSGGDLLASLGLSAGEETSEGVDEIILPATATQVPTPTEETGDSTFVSPISPINSPLATPTLPATHTATPLPATNTPVPTNTPEPSQVEPTPTNTPVPTDTPVPPTDTPEPPITEEETPTPEAEATEEPESGFKYGAPVLLAPKNETLFTGINEIKLEWEPVGELSADEQYAVRLVYKFNGETTYGGAQVKEPNWVVPIALYGQIDPPENRYEWFVAVERLNEDGSGTAISPESERMSFIWK